MRVSRPVRLALLGAAFGAVLVVPVALWAAQVIAHRGEALPGVSLNGESVAGLDRAGLEARVGALAETVRATAVELVAGGEVFTVTAAELGLDVDQAGTVERLLHAGRDGSGPSRLLSWVTSFGVDVDVHAHLVVDPGRTETAVRALDVGAAAPKEPSFAMREGELVAVEGSPGTGIPADAVVGALRAITEFDGSPIRVAVTPSAVPPRTALIDAQALVDEANRITATSLEVRAGTASTQVAPAVLRSWLTTRVGPDGRLTLAVDATRAADSVDDALAAGAVAAVEPRFDVTPEGAVVILAGQPGQVCCANPDGNVLLGFLRDRPAGPVVFPMLERVPATAVADLEALGVKEKVGEFTTKHKAGEARVINIHAVADRLRGYLLAPGDTLSMNKILGKRTIENGFVAAPAIVDGVLKPEVGGGISQFMTTLFNAAFFAGLDYGEYQSHTIYISRYPYGREATLNWPHPDLQVKNTTPYPVLVWPTYTDTEITVTLYSTRYLDKVEQTGQTKVAAQQCTRVTTERTRWYLDGRVVEDTVTALYRPKEGLQCDGTPTASASTTTVKASTTTTPGATTTPGGATTTAAPVTTAPTATTQAPTTPPPATTAPPATTSAVTTG